MADSRPEDEISLEDLVSQVEGDPAAANPAAAVVTTSAAPVPPGSSGISAPASRASSMPPVEAEKIKDIDTMLAAEDPAFAASMTELQKQGGLTTSEADIDPLDLDSIAKEKPPGRVRTFITWFLRPIDRSMGEGHTLRSRIAALPVAVISLIRALGHRTKTGALSAFKAGRRGLGDFMKLPRRAKLVALVGVAFGISAIFTVKLMLGERANPFAVGTKFLRSFAEGADARYTYDEHEPIDDFSDPIFHPEHVIMFDKFVVNLRRPSDGTNPMGLFEFYFESSNQDCAVELKDREGEARDVISRAIEQLTYGELMTGEGKERLKVTLRKAVNSFLTRGQVRRVFIKTVILKP